MNRPRHIPDRNHMVALARALALAEAGEFIRAEEIALRVAEADDANADAHFVAGVAAHGTDRDALALERFDRAIARQPAIPEFHAHRGVALTGLERLEEAEVAFRHTLELVPGDPATLGNLARVLIRQRRASEALPLIRRAHDARPDDPALLGDLAVALVANHSPHAALPLYEEALRRRPDDPEIHGNFSRALLMAGAYPKGWEENEWRWRSRQYRELDLSLPAPRWDGSDPRGQTVAILGEQGFGDALQFIRYAPLLQARGARVVVWCRPQLTRLFGAARGVDLAVSHDRPLPPVDRAIPMLSLPLLFGTTPETIPPAHVLGVPADGESVTLIPRDPAPLRVGLVWSGNNQRGFRFETLEPLFALPGVEWHSLQPGPESERARLRGLIDWSPALTDFAATAAIMAQLELVLTIDTAAAHLAGGLGRPVWLMTHATADWRWGIDGPSTPWYPTARLFRQQETGQWDGVIREVAGALRERLRQREAPHE